MCIIFFACNSIVAVYTYIASVQRADIGMHMDTADKRIMCGCQGMDGYMRPTVYI